MTKTAVLVDGGFYLKRARKFWGDKSEAERADELVDYAKAHVEGDFSERLEGGRRSLYRIFYYDCPPLVGWSVWQPWNGANTTFERSNPANKWMAGFQAELSTRLKVAMRMGTVSASGLHYVPKETALKRWIADRESPLEEGDFTLVGMKQTGVDMRIGLDVATLANGRLVDRIVLIADDSDFIPAVKMARRAGVDFIIDPMGNHIVDELAREVDGIEDLHGQFRTRISEQQAWGSGATVH